MSHMWHIFLIFMIKIQVMFISALAFHYLFGHKVYHTPINRSHSRRQQICKLCKSICNVFVMFIYGNWYTIATNSFRNYECVIKYVQHTNMKCKLKICHEYKSEVPVDNKDLCVMQISNMTWKFAVPTYLIVKVQIWQLIGSIQKFIHIFKHYKCIANAFVWPSNLTPSAMSFCTLCQCDVT